MALLVLSLCLLAGGARAVAAADSRPVVTDVRVGQHGAMTRVVLDIDRGARAELFTLADPYRLVIDLPEIGWRLPSRPLPSGIGLFGKIRYGLFKPGTTRVVVDLAAPTDIAAARYLTGGAEAPFRLVVDLVESTPEGFLRTVRDGRREVLPEAAVAEADPLPATAAAVTAPSTKVAAAYPFVPSPRRPGKVRPKPLIVLDPGHGGADPGAISPGGTYEKHITLSAAREFRQMLERTGRYRVLLARERDTLIPLRDRVTFAREAGADLFISLHADFIQTPAIRGLSVYTLSEKASDREAAELADSENKADLIAGVDLSKETPEVSNILIDLTQRETMNESARFAAFLVRELGQETELLRNSHRFAGFRVLKGPDLPSVLLEMGFLSNREDERALLKKSYRAKLGEALVRAVDRFFLRVEEASR
ncbi:MAG: N-acetylmuramoyl-L-alanine amidase [Rhodospirillales bacterium]|nr:N-acetylmuramoyl-L-alanine amidase [Rhodospirillales bacterium]